MKPGRSVWKKCLIFLILSAIGIALCSCSAGTEKPEQTNEENTDNRVVITCGGKSDFRIVRPSNADDSLMDAVLQVWETIREKTGVTLEMTDDFDEDGGGKEILIGYTNRTQTADVMESIDYFDYAVREVDDRIVVAAHTREALMTAVDVFCGELLVTEERDGAEVLVLREERTVRSGELFEFFFSQNPLASYRIVYPQDDSLLKTYADRMALKLERDFSVTLPVVSDADPAVEYEILLGVTNRVAFASCYTGAEAPDSAHYLIRAAGSNLLIVGTNARSAELACKRFLSDFMDNRYSPRFNLPDGYNRYFVAYETDPDSALTAGADLRVMSYNILSKELTDTAPDVTLRKDLLCTTFLYYMPDVVGLQEVSETGWEMLSGMLGDTYGFAGQKTPLGASSYTGLMYNRRTVRLIESENRLYTVGNQRIRLMSWGLFEHLATGERFVVMSTHWDIVLDNRQTDAEEMTALVNSLRETYRVPVITTGDFNTLESTPYYKQYLANTQQTEARYAAAQIGFALNTEVIDHITSTGDLETLFFKLLQTAQTAQASDHNPIYADFRFRGSGN